MRLPGPMTRMLAAPAPWQVLSDAQPRTGDRRQAVLTEDRVNPHLVAKDGREASAKGNDQSLVVLMTIMRHHETAPTAGQHLMRAGDNGDNRGILRVGHVFSPVESAPAQGRQGLKEKTRHQEGVCATADYNIPLSTHNDRASRPATQCGG